MYDAAYLYVAYRNKYVLVTGDRELRQRSLELNVKAISLDDII